MIRLLLVDDLVIFRQGLAALISLAYLNLRDRLQVALWVSQNLMDVDRET